MARLRTLGPRVSTADTSAARVPDKVVDPRYQSPEWLARRARILKRDGYRCVKCGAPAKVVDHIVSPRNGGTDDDANLRSLCRTCDNRLKEDYVGARRGGG